MQRANMQKIIVLTLLLLALGFCLQAQTGIYDLAYGMPYSEVLSTIEAESYELAETDSNTCTFVRLEGENELIVTTYLEPENKTLVAWDCLMPLYDGVEDDTVNWLMDLHGEEPDYDEETDTLKWTFSVTRWVRLGYDISGDYVRISYIDLDYIDIWN